MNAERPVKAWQDLVKLRLKLQLHHKPESNDIIELRQDRPCD
jgi:hypothetical protein